MATDPPVSVPPVCVPPASAPPASLPPVVVDPPESLPGPASTLLPGAGQALPVSRRDRVLEPAGQLGADPRDDESADEGHDHQDHAQVFHRGLTRVVPAPLDHARDAEPPVRQALFERQVEPFAGARPEQQHDDGDRHHQLGDTAPAAVLAEGRQRAEREPDVYGQQSAPDPDAAGAHIQREHEPDHARQRRVQQEPEQLAVDLVDRRGHRHHTDAAHDRGGEEKPYEDQHRLQWARQGPSALCTHGDAPARATRNRKSAYARHDESPTLPVYGHSSATPRIGPHRHPSGHGPQDPMQGSKSALPDGDPTTGRGPRCRRASRATGRTRPPRPTAAAWRLSRAARPGCPASCRRTWCH